MSNKLLGILCAVGCMGGVCAGDPLNKDDKWQKDETHDLTLLVSDFQKADKEQNHQKIYDFLSKRWSQVVKGPEDLKRYSKSSTIWVDREGMHSVEIVITTVNGFRVANIDQFVLKDNNKKKDSSIKSVQAGDEGKILLGHYVLRQEGGNWKFLMAFPSSVQSIFYEFITEELSFEKSGDKK